MGMFDTIRSSYPIGEHLTDVELQTKSLYNSMEDYYIDPAGQLFIVDYNGVSDWEPDDSKRFFPYKRVPNGNHGKVTPVIFTGGVEVHTASGDGRYETTILFLKGKIVEVLPEAQWTIPSQKIIQLSTNDPTTLRQTDLDNPRS
jgi:hypothetical protein